MMLFYFHDHTQSEEEEYFKTRTLSLFYSMVDDNIEVCKAYY